MNEDDMAAPDSSQPGALLDRMIRAARLDQHLYEEVETDPTSLGQAMLVVVLSSVAAGIGLGIQSALGEGATNFVVSLGFGIIAALVGWFVWAALTYFIGATILKGPETRADLGEMLRTIGFSTSPGVLRILAFVPLIGPGIFFIADVWMLVAMVIAVRQALDFSTGRAVATVLVGFLIQAVLLAIAVAALGGTAPM